MLQRRGEKCAKPTVNALGVRTDTLRQAKVGGRDKYASHLASAPSFFVDGSPENTQLSKLLAVQSVPGSQTMVDTTVLSSDEPKVFHFFCNRLKCFVASVARQSFPDARLAFCLNKRFLFCVAYSSLPARSGASSLPILTVAAERIPPPLTDVDQSRTPIMPPALSLSNRGASCDNRQAPCDRD